MARLLKPTTTAKTIPPLYQTHNFICFTVESDGTSGSDWSVRLRDGGAYLNGYTETVLLRRDFQATKRVYRIVVFKGGFFQDKERITRNIRNAAQRHKLVNPSFEIACLVRERLTNKDLESTDLWSIVIMHPPLETERDRPHFLAVSRQGGEKKLEAVFDGPWYHSDGFAFVCPLENNTSKFQF